MAICHLNIMTPLLVPELSPLDELSIQSTCQQIC